MWARMPPLSPAGQRTTTREEGEKSAWLPPLSLVVRVQMPPLSPARWCAAAWEEGEQALLNAHMSVLAIKITLTKP